MEPKQTTPRHTRATQSFGPSAPSSTPAHGDTDLLASKQYADPTTSIQDEHLPRREKLLLGFKLHFNQMSRGVSRKLSEELHKRVEEHFASDPITAKKLLNADYQSDTLNTICNIGKKVRDEWADDLTEAMRQELLEYLKDGLGEQRDRAVLWLSLRLARARTRIDGYGERADGRVGWRMGIAVGFDVDLDFENLAFPEDEGSDMEEDPEGTDGEEEGEEDQANQEREDMGEDANEIEYDDDMDEDERSRFLQWTIEQETVVDVDVDDQTDDEAMAGPDGHSDDEATPRSRRVRSVERPVWRTRTDDEDSDDDSEDEEWEMYWS